jgi:hypothetical protein
VSFAAINDQRLVAVTLRVPARGAWVADCDCEADPSVSGRVQVSLGELRLSGTVVAAQSGAFGLQRTVRVIGGAASWGKQLGAWSYHNDAGVKARLIAEDLARGIGEQLGQFAPETERVGIDYARDAQLAAADVLEDVVGSAPWWVDFQGVTHVGPRLAPAALPEADFQLRAYDPRERSAVLTVTDPSMVAIGTVLTGPALAEPLRVREYQVQADATSVRVVAWCDSAERKAGRLAELWRAVTTRVVGAPLLGLYLYRVVSMSSGRVSVQAVHREAGLPDLGPISQWPGVAGVHAELTPGVEVLVGFVGGDRARPVLTHYSGRGGEGFVPVSIVIGGPEGLPCARQTDSVEVLLPPSVITGTLIHPTLGPMPLTGVLTYPNSVTLGSIVTGSNIVKVAPP